MFNRIVLIVLSLSFLLFSCNESASSKIKSVNQSDVQDNLKFAEMSFDKISHDFGNIQEGELVKTVFKFTNTGDNDLYIVDAVGSCGCTIPKYPKNIAIKPGESGEIEVNFDSNGRPNLQRKMVRVSANTSSGSQFLSIQAFVEPKIK